MTTIVIMVRHDVAEKSMFNEIEFQPHELGVAQGIFQMLAIRDDNADVAMVVRGSTNVPEVLATKVEFRKAISQPNLSPLSRLVFPAPRGAA